MNPYSAKAKSRFVMARSGAPLTEMPAMMRRNGKLAVSHTDKMIDKQGDINADNKNDLINKIGALFDAYTSGAIEKKHSEEYVLAQAQNRELFDKAFKDKDGDAFQALGEIIGDEIWLTMGREGFAEKTLLKKPLGKGETGRIRIRQKDVISLYMTSGPSFAPASQVKQLYVYPEEYYLLANILIEDREIEQASGDILDDKYVDGLEQIMVQRDKIWKTLVDKSSSIYNDFVLFNSFTPTVFSTMRTQIMRWGIPCVSCVLSFDLWNDIIADTEFSMWFDPITKHELILEGNLGAILGVNIMTDGFRYPTLKVLEQGQAYFLGAPNTLGAITVRKELATTAINQYLIGKPNRGWFMEHIEGMAIVNTRAVVRGQKF